MRGMTLLEVLIAIGLLLTIVVGLGQASWMATRGKRAVEGRADAVHTVAAAMRRLRADFEMLYAVQPKRDAGGREDTTFQTGLIGRDGGDEDHVSLSTFSGRRYTTPLPAADAREIGYAVEAIPSEEREGYPSEAKRVIRREDLSPDDKLDEGGEAMVLLPAVLQFNLEYWDGKEGEWVRDWDSTDRTRQGQLPRAVRMTIAVPNPRGGEAAPLVMQSAVMVGMGPDPIKPPGTALTGPAAGTVPPGTTPITPPSGTTAPNSSSATEQPVTEEIE